MDRRAKGVRKGFRETADPTGSWELQELRDNKAFRASKGLPVLKEKEALLELRGFKAPRDLRVAPGLKVLQEARGRKEAPEI